MNEGPTTKIFFLDYPYISNASVPCKIIHLDVSKFIHAQHYILRFNECRGILIIVNINDLTKYLQELSSTVVDVGVPLGTCLCLCSSPLSTLDERANEKITLYNPNCNPNAVRIGPLLGALQNNQFDTLK